MEGGRSSVDGLAPPGRLNGPFTSILLVLKKNDEH